MDNILLLIIIILIAVFLYVVVSLAKYNKYLRSIILKAILIAENEYNKTTGEERLELATRYVYSKLPMKLKLIISQETLLKFIEKLIQKIFDEIKNVLDYNKPSKEV